MHVHDVYSEQYGSAHICCFPLQSLSVPEALPILAFSLEILPCACGPLSTFVTPMSLRVVDLCPKGAPHPCISLDILWLVAADTTVTHTVMPIAYSWHTHDITWKGRRVSLVRAGQGTCEPHHESSRLRIRTFPWRLHAGVSAFCGQGACGGGHSSATALATAHYIQA